MLIKIFEVDPSVQSESFLEEVKLAVSRLGYDIGTIRASFSALSGTTSAIRILVTGLDAFGRERSIVAAVGEVCRRQYERTPLSFPGISNPALPNQNDGR